jgi:hypothetical protein
MLEDIALAWEHLVTYGVEPSDIRRLLHRKSRDLWKRGRRPPADLYRPLARYNVTEQDKMDLIDGGDLAKARLWGPQDARLVGDIGHAWKHLAFYGVEPSEIRRLIDRKFRSAAEPR